MRIAPEQFHGLSQEEQIANLERLGRSALEQFEVVPTSMQPLVHAENTTFKVTSPQGVFNLRISRPGYQSLQNIRSEIAWLNALRTEGFRVPKPFHGRLVVAEHDAVPEPRACALFRWMDGEFRREWSPEDARKTGALIAHLHEFVRTWKPPGDFHRSDLHRWAFEKREFPKNAHLSEADHELLQRVEEEASESIRNLPRHPDWYGLIHADMHQNNVLFDRDEANVIDFDDCGYGYFVYDFAACLAYRGHVPTFPQIREALFAGYESVRPLPPGTREMLVPFLRWRLAGVSHWVLTRTDNPRMRETGHEWVEWMCNQIRRFADEPLE